MKLSLYHIRCPFDIAIALVLFVQSFCKGQFHSRLTSFWRCFLSHRYRSCDVEASIGDKLWKAMVTIMKEKGLST